MFYGVFTGCYKIAAKNMLAALIKGKLTRTQENMEDLLTSNVFGLMQYLPPDEALIPFLNQAEDLNGNRPLAALSPDIGAEYEFWPGVEESGCIGCEPDLLLRLRDHQCLHLIFVEAKYLSGKSSEEDNSVLEPHDQLAREWDNLASMALRENATPLLLYVTADIGIPRHEIEVSAKEYSVKRANRTDKAAFACAWISWRKLSTIFRRASTNAARDLCTMADRLGLCYFHTMTWFDAKPLANWNFANPARPFQWKAPGDTAGNWGFSK